MNKLLLVIISSTFLMRGFGDPETIPRDLNFTFTFYSRNNTNGIKLILGNKEQLIASGFRGLLSTKVLVHGFLNNENSTWIKRVREEVFLIEEANIVVFDWSSCAKNLLYMEVVECVKVTSQYLGSFLKFLETDGNLNLRKTHLIGHSLGAQVVGIGVLIFPPKTIARITGLDPAGPLFEDVDVMERLNPESAIIVDVIHTCIYFIGMKKPIGTLDFYPNGGFNHPSCAFFDLSCHHRQSQEYFIDSFRNRKKYMARKCRSLKQAVKQKCFGRSGSMGYFIRNSSPGIYHLKVD